MRDPIYKPEKFYTDDINDLVEIDLEKGGPGSGTKGHLTPKKFDVNRAHLPATSDREHWLRSLKPGHKVRLTDVPMNGTSYSQTHGHVSHRDEKTGEIHVKDPHGETFKFHGEHGYLQAGKDSKKRPFLSPHKDK